LSGYLLFTLAIMVVTNITVKNLSCYNAPARPYAIRNTRFASLRNDKAVDWKKWYL